MILTCPGHEGGAVEGETERKNNYIYMPVIAASAIILWFRNLPKNEWIKMYKPVDQLSD